MNKHKLPVDWRLEPLKIGDRVRVKQEFQHRLMYEREIVFYDARHQLEDLE